MKKSSTGYFPVPKHQADAVLNQANPVSGTKYTVLDTMYNVRLISLAVKCTWTVQPTPLEMHVTLDGRLITLIQNDPVSGTSYYPYYLSFLSEDGTLTTQQDIINKPFFLEGRTVKIEVEITGGTVSNLSARVKYAKW